MPVTSRTRSGQCLRMPTRIKIGSRERKRGLKKEAKLCRHHRLSRISNYITGRRADSQLTPAVHVLRPLEHRGQELQVQGER